MTDTRILSPDLRILIESGPLAHQGANDPSDMCDPRHPLNSRATAFAAVGRNETKTETRRPKFDLREPRFAC
jgi:hypothetical protein